MAQKYISKGKDVTAYKWVKIIQDILLIVFGAVLIIFCTNTDLQGALGYIAASILLIYALLTIGFATIFDKGLLSVENLAGSAIIAISIMIFINPNIVIEYIPAFLGTVLIVYGLIFILDLIIMIYKKTVKVSNYIIHSVAILILLGLGITALVLTYQDNSNKQAIKSVMMVVFGVMLILIGAILIFYYAANPKYKVQSKSVITNDGKQITVTSSRNTMATEEKPKKEKKNKTKKIDIKDKPIEGNEKGEVAVIESEK